MTRVLRVRRAHRSWTHGSQPAVCFPTIRRPSQQSFHFARHCRDSKSRASDARHQRTALLCFLFSCHVQPRPARKPTSGRFLLMTAALWLFGIWIARQHSGLKTTQRAAILLDFLIRGFRITACTSCVAHEGTR
jgi:hypothetical protein